MKRLPAPEGPGDPPEIAGALYALDRRPRLGGWWSTLARFRGSYLFVTRLVTRFVAPLAGVLAVRGWRVSPAEVLGTGTPFLLCLTRETLREGVPLLLAEWMEFRRAVPAAALNLVVRVSPPAKGSVFGLVAPLREQVRALGRQLGVPRSGVYLWVREADDAGDERLLEAAQALVVVARGQGFADPLALALRKGKPVIAPEGEELPPGHPYAFATRPAVLRFVGEPRRVDTSAVPWPIPEAMELARALGRLASAAAGVGWHAVSASEGRGEAPRASHALSASEGRATPPRRGEIPPGHGL